MGCNASATPAIPQSMAKQQQEENHLQQNAVKGMMTPPAVETKAVPLPKQNSSAKKVAFRTTPSSYGDKSGDEDIFSSNSPKGVVENVIAKPSVNGASPTGVVVKQNEILPGPELKLNIGALAEETTKPTDVNNANDSNANTSSTTPVKQLDEENEKTTSNDNNKDATANTTSPVPLTTTPTTTSETSAPPSSSTLANGNNNNNNNNSAAPESTPIAPVVEVPLIGTKYVVHKLRLGKGHYASVYKGTEIATGKDVAIKMIEKRLSKAERLKLEVEIMRKAGAHPNIVELYDVYETPTHVQLVLELVEGGELFEHLVSHGPYTELDAARHIHDLVGAVAFLHSLNIIHRDLKPENLLLTTKGSDARLKVADFGLAKNLVNDVTRTVVGTWAYCAPEIKSKRNPTYDNKCDIWSIGVITYILLSAYHPFDPNGDLSDDDITLRIQKCKYDFNDPAWVNISPLAKDFITKILVMEASARPSAAEALKHPFLNQIENLIESPVSPTIPSIDNSKLANFQEKQKMNPLQKAVHAMSVQRNKKAYQDSVKSIKLEEKGGKKGVAPPPQKKQPPVGGLSSVREEDSSSPKKEKKEKNTDDTLSLGDDEEQTERGDTVI